MDECDRARKRQLLQTLPTRRSSHYEKAIDTLPACAAQRAALQLPPRRAPSESAKIATISRAKGGQLQAPVGRALVLH